ncbi:hypothetical protein GWI33_014044 [Rhynchophorus ferrugineus]|uniref:Uncharacterized protein n=1 Tax=Rhynchophorus ferrugineus TaxID=354439 RepID=A0A834I2G5_RHYFE|nr:hypothetical protein GWI33_014044 [Rhynchophorus ferrugineus]
MMTVFIQIQKPNQILVRFNEIAVCPVENLARQVFAPSDRAAKLNCGSFVSLGHTIKRNRCTWNECSMSNRQQWPDEKAHSVFATDAASLSGTGSSVAQSRVRRRRRSFVVVVVITIVGVESRRFLAYRHKSFSGIT